MRNSIKFIPTNHVGHKVKNMYETPSQPVNPVNMEAGRWREFIDYIIIEVFVFAFLKLTVFNDQEHNEDTKRFCIRFLLFFLCIS